MIWLTLLWKNNTISFPTTINLYKTLVFSMQFYLCQSWTLTAELERRFQAFETNDTQECRVYHTKSIKQRNMYGSRSVSSSDVGSFYCQPSNITSYRGSAMSVVIIRCRKSHHEEQWMVVVAEKDFVNHGRTMS